MQIGEMPKVGLMYDEILKGKSAEEIYDEIMRKLKKSNSGLLTFRGAGRGDIIDRGETKFGAKSDAMSLDDFCKEALRQGLIIHKERGRGLIPEGLEEAGVVPEPKPLIGGGNRFTAGNGVSTFVEALFYYVLVQ